MFNTYVQQPNAPGLRRVVLLPDDQMAPNGQLIGSPTVLEFHFPTTRGSLAVSDSGSGPLGRLFSTQVSLTLPRALAAIQDFLTAHQDRRYILYIEDANGSIHRIGHSGDGAEVSISYSIDAGLNSTTVSLTHASPVALPYGAGGLVGIHTGPGIIEGSSIEDILASSTATVIEQLSMISASPRWVAANLSVSTIPTSYQLSHSLSTTKVAAMFFEPDGTQLHTITYEVIDPSTIEITLPGGMSSFTGEVFIIKRDAAEPSDPMLLHENVLLAITAKGEGDVITHSHGELRVVTFYNTAAGGRPVPELYSSDVEANAFTLRHDFTSAKFTGLLLCVKTTSSYSSPNKTVEITLTAKGNGDIIGHNMGQLRIITFYDAADGHRPMPDFWASDVITDQFTLRNDFTNNKYTGKLICITQ